MINYVNITCIIFSTRTFLVFDTSLYIPPLYVIVYWLQPQ
ncbi:K7_03322p [Saccharomyces cerevisiae Kyokai no. 7]|uniref:K7_03322p n=1 Tax=Saccharomyces cerevisiae (strain Kyokai no. 7 / NBRC 101557) TaxID=721032 RepID=G2WFP9_YEASK|nr:K7_03322p [Saccharomyces cerevisiae Kyokai no. 7]